MGRYEDFWAVTEAALRYALRRLGHGPEVLVAAHQRAEPGVLELLLAPGRRGRDGVARDLASRLDDRVDVEERAVRVEDVAADRRHRSMVSRRGRPGRLQPWRERSSGGSSPVSTKA